MTLRFFDEIFACLVLLICSTVCKKVRGHISVLTYCVSSQDKKQIFQLEILVLQYIFAIIMLHKKCES